MPKNKKTPSKATITPPKEEKNNLLKKISLFFIVTALAVILIIVLTYTSRAEIYITPAIKSNTISFRVIVSENTIKNNELPVIKGKIWESNLEGNKQFQVQNTNIEKVGKSKGEIIIINNNTRNQTLVRTTRFLTPDNFLFRLDRTVVIPAQSKIRATVTADKAGIEGDIKPPLRLTIPGLSKSLQDKIYGEVAAPFYGGLIKIGQVTDQEVSSALSKFIEELSEQDQVNFLADYLSQEGSLPSESIDIINNTEIISQQITPEIGSESDIFTIDLSVKSRGVIFDKSSLIKISQNKFINSLPESERFISIDRSSLNVSLDDIDIENKQAYLTVKITGYSIVNETFIDKNQLKGKSIQQIKDMFSDNPQIKKVEVYLNPFWVKKVPQMEKNIFIFINSPAIE